MGLRFDTEQHEIFLRLRGWPMGGVVCGPHMPGAPPWRGLPHDREMLQLVLQPVCFNTHAREHTSTVHHHTTRHARCIYCCLFNDTANNCNSYFAVNKVPIVSYKDL
jgi:hypothetical protein